MFQRTGGTLRGLIGQSMRLCNQSLPCKRIFLCSMQVAVCVCVCVCVATLSPAKSCRWLRAQLCPGPNVILHSDSHVACKYICGNVSDRVVNSTVRLDVVQCSTSYHVAPRRLRGTAVHAGSLNPFRFESPEIVIPRVDRGARSARGRVGARWGFETWFILTDVATSDAYQLLGSDVWSPKLNYLIHRYDILPSLKPCFMSGALFVWRQSLQGRSEAHRSPDRKQDAGS